MVVSVSFRHVHKHIPDIIRQAVRPHSTFESVCWGNCGRRVWSRKDTNTETMTTELRELPMVIAAGDG